MAKRGLKPLQVWRMAARIRHALYELDAAEMAEGLSWYSRARLSILRDVADPTGLSPEAAIGVTAALSPGCSWRQNLYDAAWLALDRSVALPLAAYKTNVRKALSIIEGADPVKVLGDRKVGAFYDNLLNPATSWKVTVDRHAIRVALGKDLPAEEVSKLIDNRVNAYEEVCEAYRRVAEGVGLVPSQVQAATWVNYRNRMGIVG